MGIGIVIGFPITHARASSRAAIKVSSSEVRPDRTATSVRNIEAQYSAGMLSRCHHLETVGSLTNTSDAIASLEAHRAITARKFAIPDAMPRSLGPIVLKRKANLSLDGRKSLGHTVPMAESETEAQYKGAFIERVKACRIAKGWKQWQMAEALGPMPQDKYKQYETRSLLPHHLIERFSLICGVNPQWLLTGRGDKALKPLQAVPGAETAQTRPKKQRRSKAA